MIKIAMNKYKAQVAVLGFLTTISINGYAWTDTSDDKWRSGWGQGISEAQVTQGSGNSIYVACSDPVTLSDGSSISFTLAGESPQKEVLVIFDSGKPETFHVNSFGTITSASHVDADNFEDMIKKLKKHKKVYVRFTDGKEATFTLRGASKAIGSDCKSAFYYDLG